MDLLQYANTHFRPYPGQRFLLKVVAGLPLSTSERVEFQHPISGESSSYTEADYLRRLYDEGRASSNEVGPRSWFVLAMGRRAGKTMIGSLLALHALRRLIEMEDPHKECGVHPKSRLSVTSISPSKDASTILFEECHNLIKGDAKLGRLLAHNTSRHFNFRTPAGQREDPAGNPLLRLAFRSANAKYLRGSANYAVLLDDMAFFDSERAPHIIPATAPSLAHTWPMGAQMIIASTPCEREDDDFQIAFNNCFPGKQQQVLALQLPTWVLNPTIPREFYQMQYANDPRSFSTEYGAEFVRGA